ncbi:membrane protein insertase YidC [Nannocystaceae bacterium ST9]
MSTQQRMLLAGLISLLIFVGYFYLFPPPEPPPAAADEAGEAAKAEGDDAGEKQAEPSAPEPAAPAAPLPDSSVPKLDHQLINEALAIHVGNGGEGLITGVEVLGEQFATPEGKGLDFLALGEGGEGLHTLELGFVSDETDFAWPSQRGQLISKDERHIALRRRANDIEVSETLTLLDGYEARYEVVVANRGTAGELAHRLELTTRMGLGAESSRYDIHRALCRTPEDLEDFDHGDVEDEDERIKGGIDWFALDSKYFLQAIVPTERFSGCLVQSDETGTMLVNTGLAREITLAPGQQQRYVFALYLGAKRDLALEAFPASEPLADTPEVDLAEAIDWGWFSGLSKFLGTMMLDLLRWFYQLTSVWGVAIILLTVVVKLVLLPLTIKQYKSMRKLKEINPELTKLRDKYKDDKVKLQQEMQALFQRTGANPLSGCLPLLIQFPVWIALYAMLGAVVDLYHEDFLWLPDLTQPDPYYILPVSMGVLMFIQTKMNPSTGDEQQMKMMLWMMPGIFVVMMLFLPSGLGVYIFANIVLSLIQSFVQLRIPSGDPATAPAPAPTGTVGKVGKGRSTSKADKAEKK